MNRKRKAEILLETAGDIREEYIAEAEGRQRLQVRFHEMERPAKIRKWTTWLPAAALICAAAVAAVVIIRPQLQPERDSGGKTNKETAGGSTAMSTEGETRIEPRWEDKALNAQYAAFEFNGLEYSTSGAALGADSVSKECLGTIELKGYDIYENKEYTAKGEIRRIEGIAQECALAIMFREPGGTEYYAYVNCWYAPDTLGQFMEDLDFYGNLRTESIEWMKAAGDTAVREYSADGPDRETLLELLSRYGGLVNVYEQEHSKIDWSPVLMSVGVRFPIFARGNSIWITQSGYLVTNILDTAKAFYLGEEEAYSFMNAVLGEEIDWENIVEINNRMREEAETAVETTSPAWSPDMGSSTRSWPGPGGGSDAEEAESAAAEAVSGYFSCGYTIGNAWYSVRQ